MARHLPALLVILAATVFTLAAVARYHGYLGERDFLLYATVPCDPERHACFTGFCSEDDPDCSPDPYAKAAVSAQAAPACFEEHSCSAFSCEGRERCAISFCSEDALEANERCTASPALTP